MARSRSDYSPDKASDNDSAQNRLDAAEKRRQKKQARKTTVDPKPSVAFGSVLPPTNSPETRPDSRITVEPTVSVSDSPLDDSETRDTSAGQENMDEVLERKNYKEEEQEKAEIQAEKELYARLARVFPKEGVGGSTVTQDVLIRMFLKAHPDSHKFILYGRDGHLAKEIFSFFRGSNFTRLLNLKDFQKNEDAKRQAREYLIKNGVNLWENFAQKNSDFGTEKMFDDLERIRNSKDVPSVAESIRIDSGEDIQNDSSLSKKSVDEIRDTSRKNSTDHNRETNDALKNAFGNTGASLDDQQVEVQPDAKRGVDADGIVEGFGVVGDASPEIVMEGDGEQKMGDVVSEKSGNSEGGENVLEGEYLPDGEESLQELRDRVKILKGSSDEARNRFLTLRHRNTSKWLAVKKALFSSRSKEPPQALVDEIEVLKGDWNYKLTLYKDAVVELTKREAAERKLNGKEQGLLMAEAIRELDVRGSVENYDAWKNASWGDRKGSGFLRMLGRARDWAEEYRKLDWKKRVAISAVVVGTGVAGVAVGSAGLVGVGVAGSTIVRLLGSYGAGRGSYEFLEGRANQKTLQYHEAALSNVEKIEDIGFLEERMRSYADRTQKDLDRAIAGNRKRVAASVALGSVLFLGGTAFAHRGAIQEFSGKVSNEFSKFLEQMKIITGFEDFHTAPVSISGGVADRAAEMAGAAKRVVIERAQEGVVLPDTSSGEIPHPIPTPPIVDAGAPVESGGLVSGNAGAGVIDGGQAAEAAGKIVEGDASEIGKILVAGKDGNSFEGMFMNAGYDEAASHRAVLRFMREAGVTQEKMDKIFGGAKAIIVPDDSDPKTPFRIIGITRESGGAIISTTKVPGTEDLIRKITDASELSNAVPQGVSSAVELGQVSNIELPKVESAVEVSPLEPTHIQEIQPAVQLESMESVSLPEIETLPSSPEPPDAFDRYGTVAKVIPPVAGLATAGVVGKTLFRMKRDGDEKIFKKSQEILSQVPRLMDISRAQRVALDKLRISEIFASSSKENPADTLVFNEAKKRVCSVLFGSESVPENLVSRSLSEFITNEEENDDAKIRDRLRKGFSIFQNLFSQTGGRIPKEVLRTLTVGDVPDIVTKRFIERQSS